MAPLASFVSARVLAETGRPRQIGHPSRRDAMRDTSWLGPGWRVSRSREALRRAERWEPASRRCCRVTLEPWSARRYLRAAIGTADQAGLQDLVRAVAGWDGTALASGFSTRLSTALVRPELPRQTYLSRGRPPLKFLADKLFVTPISWTLAVIIVTLDRLMPGSAPEPPEWHEYIALMWRT